MPLTLHRASLAPAQEGSEMGAGHTPDTAGVPAGITAGAFWGQLRAPLLSSL